MEETREKAVKKFSEELGKFIGRIIVWFISTAFIMWGWNTLAPHINCPTFGYWEMFAMRMGFSYLINIIVGNFSKERGN